MAKKKVVENVVEEKKVVEKKKVVKKKKAVVEEKVVREELTYGISYDNELPDSQDKDDIFRHVWFTDVKGEIWKHFDDIPKDVLDGQLREYVRHQYDIHDFSEANMTLSVNLKNVCFGMAHLNISVYLDSLILDKPPDVSHDVPPPILNEMSPPENGSHISHLFK